MGRLGAGRSRGDAGFDWERVTVEEHRDSCHRVIDVSSSWIFQLGLAASFVS